MKIRLFQFSILLLFLFILGITSCRSYRKTIAPAPPAIEETAYRTSCYLIESLYVPSCKMALTNGNQSISLNGSIYIQPDSVCFFRGRWLLFEIRGAIYRDSFVMVNYLERTYYKGKNDYLQKITGFPVNPESLMMLFTADRCEETYRNKFNFTRTTGSVDKILMQGQNRSLLEMNINAGNHTIESIALYNSSQRQPLFNAVYGNYEQYPQFVLPTMIDISARDGNTPIQIKAEIQQVLFNQPQQMSMTLPPNYKVVVLE